MVVCWIFVVGTLAMNASAPGPRLSANHAFNEKAKWLRRNLADGKCDVLVLGSSIALNSIDAGSFAERWPNKVVNSGFWGMTSADARAMLAALLQTCQPKLVILPTFHGDFGAEQGSFEWPQFTRYITGGVATNIWTYARSMDIPYYALHIRDPGDDLLRERRSYQSLNFDRIGSVNFACENFRISPQRWDGYLGKTALPPPDPGKLAALSDIARTLQDRGIPFIVAGVPLRPVAEAALASPPMTAFWQTLETSVVPHGARFMRSLASNGYEDRHFSDFVHLNACGARKWTSELLDLYRDVIDRQLRSPAN